MRAVKTILIGSILWWCSCHYQLLAATKTDPPPPEFKQRLDDYMRVRAKALQGIPALPAKAEAKAIEQHRKAAVEAIRKARTGAKQGDVLTPEIQALLTKIVRSETKGKEGAAAKKVTKQGNPAVEAEGTASVTVAVNAIYPDSAPSSSVPPTILLRLPKLPKELDYRFVGRHLILRDTAGVIIDFVPNASLP